jgi:hypothetical protein
MRSKRLLLRDGDGRRADIWNVVRLQVVSAAKPEAYSLFPATKATKATDDRL